MECDIAPIAEHHIEGFRAALDTVAKERRYLAFFEAPPLESATAFVLGNIQKDYPQFVALVQDQVVGWCDIIPSTKPAERHTGTLGMGLLPGWRGKGIGRRLMQATIDKARDLNLTRIELTVRENNDNAIVLYKSMGFETEGLKRKAHRNGDAYENILMMALLF